MTPLLKMNLFCVVFFCFICKECTTIYNHNKLRTYYSTLLGVKKISNVTRIPEFNIFSDLDPTLLFEAKIKHIVKVCKLCPELTTSIQRCKKLEFLGTSLTGK